MTEEHFGKVIAFRAWSVSTKNESMRLGSYGHGPHEWLPGMNTAECKGREEWSNGYGGPWWERVHHSPGNKCQCGFYGFNDPASIFGEETETVWGAFLAWGKLQAHPEGIRAEYAEPVVLAKPFDGFEKRCPEASERLRECATHYACMLVEHGKLKEAALAIAKPIPEEHRAKYPSPASKEAQMLTQGGATLTAYNQILKQTWAAPHKSINRQVVTGAIPPSAPSIMWSHSPKKKSPWGHLKRGIGRP